MKNLFSEEINLLRRNARSVVRELGLLNDAYFEVGVTLAERHLLIELTCCTHPTMGEIAERLLLDKSTASRLIAKAMKKGYIQCTTDETDKRKRYLQLTETGVNTLNAFEPIAFQQTKEALLTLTEQEIELVFRGVALYAKGLKNSRLANKELPSSTKPIEQSLSEIHQQLTKQGYLLKPYTPENESSLYNIFQEVVDSGNQFPYESSSLDEFHEHFLKSHVYVCISSTQEVIGGFFIHPNSSGRSSHIANAAYMIKSTHRGQGLGTLLVKASLHLAKSLNYQAIQFNMVLSQNKTAITLYQKLQFKIIGMIPQAIRNPDGSYQEGYIMHRKI